MPVSRIRLIVSSLGAGAGASLAGALGAAVVAAGAAAPVPAYSCAATAATYIPIAAMANICNSGLGATVRKLLGGTSGSDAGKRE